MTSSIQSWRLTSSTEISANGYAGDLGLKRGGANTGTPEWSCLDVSAALADDHEAVKADKQTDDSSTKRFERRTLQVCHALNFSYNAFAYFRSRFVLFHFVRDYSRFPRYYPTLHRSLYINRLTHLYVILVL
jgi:hypothetical protein